jgi:quinol monooxygenase YgiN
MYAAILRMRFPEENREAVIRFQRDEIAPVIRDNPGFRAFQVLDDGTPGELVMIDTWDSREASVAAIQQPAAVAIHARYAELGLEVAAATRYTVLTHTTTHTTN